MFEITITKKLNANDMKKIMGFLFSVSDEISFSSLHHYHVDEEDANCIINEYKKSCIEKHHQFSKLYQENNPIILKQLVPLHIHTDEEFNNYIDEIFQDDIALCQKMELILEGLQNETNQIDYRQIFPRIAAYYKEKEIHMFDAASASLIPIDIVFYHLSDEIQALMENLPSLSKPILMDKEGKIFFYNPVFYKNEEVLALIYNALEKIIMTLNDEEYEQFKKLKIKHKKERVEYEHACEE